MSRVFSNLRFIYCHSQLKKLDLGGSLFSHGDSHAAVPALHASILQKGAFPHFAANLRELRLIGLLVKPRLDFLMQVRSLRQSAEYFPDHIAYIAVWTSQITWVLAKLTLNQKPKAQQPGCFRVGICGCLIVGGSFPEALL